MSKPRSWRFTPILFLRVLHSEVFLFTVKTDVFWVNFCIDESLRLSFIFLPLNIPSFYCHLLKRSPFLHWIAFCTLIKNQLGIFVGLFLGSLLCSIDVYIYLSNNTCLDYYTYIIGIWVDWFLPLCVFQNFFLAILVLCLLI